MRIQVRPGKIRDVDFNYVDKEMKYTDNELRELEEAIGTSLESEKRRKVIEKREEFFDLYMAKKI